MESVVQMKLTIDTYLMLYHIVNLADRYKGYDENPLHFQAFFGRFCASHMGLFETPILNKCFFIFTMSVKIAL